MGCTSSNTGTKEPKADAPVAEGAEGAAPAENAAPAEAAPAEVAPVEEWRINERKEWGMIPKYSTSYRDFTPMITDLLIRLGMTQLLIFH